MNRILITGATGFVGRACVAEARRRGLEVVALVRRDGLPDWRGDRGIDVIRADLSDAASIVALTPAAEGCQAVIHAAAHLGGDAARHAADTVAATVNLMQAIGMTRLVLVSSIAVYDTDALAPGDVVDEAAPLIDPDTPRDAYSAGKMRQEDLCRARGGALWILRPGAIYGPGRTWHALMGFRIGKLNVTVTSDGPLPMTHVAHTAQALVAAALTDPHGVRVVNVIDDDPPTRSRFLRAHRQIVGWPRLNMRLPYGVWIALSRAVAALGLRAPGLLHPASARARLMPLVYANAALRAELGVQDRAPFEEMLARSIVGQAP